MKLKQFDNEICQRDNNVHPGFPFSRSGGGPNLDEVFPLFKVRQSRVAVK